MGKMSKKISKVIGLQDVRNSRQTAAQFYNAMLDEQIEKALKKIEQLPISYHEKTAVIFNYVYLASGIITPEELTTSQTYRTEEQINEKAMNDPTCKYAMLKMWHGRYKSFEDQIKGMDTISGDDSHIIQSAIDIAYEYPFPYVTKDKGKIGIYLPL